jgi:hypothetical protein
MTTATATAPRDDRAQLRRCAALRVVEWLEPVTDEPYEGRS